MKPTDNEPQDPTTPVQGADAVDPGAARKKKKNKRIANGVVLVMGALLYLDLFAQPGCDDSTTGGGGGAIDAAAVDAPVDAPGSAVVDAPTGGGDIDAPAGGGDCFDQAADTAYKGNLGCSVAGNTTFKVSKVDGTVYTLMPFGQQGQQNFMPKAGAPNQAVATGVVILQQPNHTCTLTCTPSTPKPTLSMTCVRQVDSGTPPMCTETYGPP